MLYTKQFIGYKFTLDVGYINEQNLIVIVPIARRYFYDTWQTVSCMDKNDASLYSGHGDFSRTSDGYFQNV